MALIGEWDTKMIDRKIQLTTKKKARVNGLNLTIDPLFIASIISYQSSTKFKPPTIELYDATKDLVNHVYPFRSHIEQLVK